MAELPGYAKPIVLEKAFWCNERKAVILTAVCFFYLHFLWLAAASKVSIQDVEKMSQRLLKDLFDLIQTFGVLNAEPIAMQVNPVYLCKQSYTRCGNKELSQVFCIGSPMYRGVRYWYAPSVD